MRLTKLDGLRGIFSLMVVIHHYERAFPGNETLYLPPLMHDNFLITQSKCFVDFFFVLSGLVIAMNYDTRLNTMAQLKSFSKKRFVRLYPLLFYTCIVYFAFELVRNIFLPQFTSTPTSVQKLLIMTADTLLFTNSTRLVGTSLGMNGPSWSISSEMIAYLTFGVISVLFAGRQKKFALSLVIFLAFLFCLYNRRYFYNSTYGFVRALICFNLGYFVFRLSLLKFRVPDFIEYLIPLILIPLFFKLESYVPTYREDMLGLFTIPLFFSLSILALTKTNGSLSRFLETGPVQFLGRISYSVYLNHAILIVLIPRIALKGFHMQPDNWKNIALLLLVIATTLVYSAITYELIEKRGGKWLSGVMERFFPTRPEISGEILSPVSPRH